MKVISVDICDFLSIQKAYVELDDNGLLLLEGYNFDVDRANGAGKTAILNALSFGLYEKLPRKVTASEVMRRGAKKTTVTVKVALDDGEYVVVRSRPKGVTFFKVDGDNLVELKITQEEFESKLRLTYNQFVVAMYCSQANSSAASPRFLLLNDSDKKQFLLQLLNLDDFALCKKRSDDTIQVLQNKLLAIQNQINILQSKIDVFSESKLDEVALSLEIAENEQYRARFLSELQKNETVPKPDFGKYQKLEDDISQKKTEFVQMRARREMLLSQWNTLGRKIRPFNSADLCPTCGTSLDNTHAKSIHDVEMNRLQQERLVLKQQIDEIDALLQNESKVTQLAQKLAEKKQTESAAYVAANQTRIELTAKIRTYESSLEILKKKLANNLLLVQKIDALQHQQQELREQLTGLNNELEMQKTVSGIYSPTGAQAYVLDSAVALFNEHISRYVGILWSNLTYELQSYKENVKGDVVAKFSESIVMDGKPISLGSLSGGELKALSICADMALLNLLEQQFGIHMSPLIFDEAFDGLDAAGKEFALDLIKELAHDRQVIVIDHASEMRAAFDKVLRVEKRNGISSLVQ